MDGSSYADRRRHPPRRDRGGRYPNPAHLRTFATFFREHRRFTADLSPTDAMSPDPETHALRSADRRRAVAYREDTEGLALDLSEFGGAVQVVAVDTRAAYREFALGTFSSAPHILRLPHPSDWVLALDRFDDP